MPSIDLLNALLPSPTLSAGLAAVAAAAAVPLTRFAAHRTVAQPLSMALEQESVVLAAVLADPTRYPFVAALNSSDFAVGVHARIWQALVTAAGPDVIPGPDANEDTCRQLAADLALRGDRLAADIRDQLAASPTAGPADLDTLERLAVSNEGITDEQMLAAGEAVLAAGDDRNRLAGTGLVTPSATPDSARKSAPPLHRVHVAPSRTRLVTSALACAATAALIPAFLTSAGLTGAAAVLGGGALAALLALCLIISLVDLDTLYIDIRAFGVGAVVSWSLAVAATVAAGVADRLLVGAGLVVGTALVFEVANRVYKIVRGMDGVGFGDTIIIVATAGVPAALTGSVQLGFWAFMAGMIAGIIFWVIGALRGKLTRATPFAFGPYLAAGWVLGWIAHLLFG